MLRSIGLFTTAIAIVVGMSPRVLAADSNATADMCFYDVQAFADTVKTFVDRKDPKGGLVRALLVASQAVGCGGKQLARNQPPMWDEAGKAYATAGDLAFDLEQLNDASKYWRLSNTYYEKVLADPKRYPDVVTEAQTAVTINNDKLGLPSPQASP